MKTYADVVEQGGFRKRSRHNPIGLFLLGILLAAVGFVTGESSAQSMPHELTALRALMKRVESVAPRPVKVSATQVEGNGYRESQDLELAWLGVMQRFLPEVRDAHPDLIRYWIVRTEDFPMRPVFNSETNTFAWPDIEPDKNGHYKWAFSSQVFKVVTSTPGLTPFASRLQAASDSLIQGVRESHWNSSDDDVSEEERAAKRRAIDMEGRRLALIKVIRGMLGAVGELDPEHNTAWKPLYQFLKQDAGQQWTKHSIDRAEKQRVDFAMSAVYYGAHNPPAATTAHFEKLEAIDQLLTGMRPQLLENALAPGQTPMAFLTDDAREFINSQIEFDRELVRALDSPEVRANPSLIRAFLGMYDIWKSLERYEDFLRAGRWTQSIGILMETARSVLMAKSWREWKEIDPDTGKSSSDFAVQRVGQTIDLLNKYKEGWLEHGEPDGPLYVAVEVDEQGRRLWSHSSWSLWKWVTTSDLDDLRVDGRVVEGLGRRWLLPAGSRVRSIRNLQDVRTADAREVIVGLDPSGAWTGARKAAP